MQIRKVGAGSGARWLNQSTNVIEKNARPLLLAGLILVVMLFLSVLVAPLFGPAAKLVGLATSLLYPALMGGLIAMAAQADTGQTPRPANLFAAFPTGRALQLMILALPQLLFSMVVNLLSVATFGAENLDLIARGEEPVMDAVNTGMMGWLFLVLGLGLVLSFSATLFGIPLVMMQSTPGLTAIGLSLLAALRNMGAVLVYLLCIGAAILIAGFASMLVYLVLNAILGLVGPTAQAVGTLLLAIAFFTFMFVVLACGHLLAWRDVFGEPPAGEEPAPGEREISAEL